MGDVGSGCWRGEGDERVWRVPGGPTVRDELRAVGRSVQGAHCSEVECMEFYQAMAAELGYHVCLSADCDCAGCDDEPDFGQ